MPKSDFNKVAKHGCSPVNLVHIFRTTFIENTSGGLQQYVLQLSRTIICLYHFFISKQILKSTNAIFNIITDTHPFCTFN